MVLTLREQVVIKEWNKRGVMGLRVSSLVLLENIGREDVSKMLVRHTVKMMPEGLWDRAEGFCREICFLAGVDFDEKIYMDIIVYERGEREDVEFDR